MEAVILVFLRPFKQGQVKTRLAKSIGEQKALAVYEALVDHTMKQLREINDKAEIILCYSDEPGASETRSSTFKHIVQQGDSLGERMHQATLWAHKQGFQKKLIIGTDCYELSSDHLHQALHALDATDVVIGPAEDGGYYLIGMKEPNEALFSDIPWSTEHTFTATTNKMKSNTIEWQELPILSDVDHLEDVLKYPKLAEIPGAEKGKKGE